MPRKQLEGDAALLAKWKKIRDPKKALQALVENWIFLGSDPYYRDLDAALREMAERCSQ